MFYIKPKEGLKVRDPKTLKHIPEEGCWVFKSPYWTARLLAGEVERVKPHLPSVTIPLDEEYLAELPTHEKKRKRNSKKLAA